MYARSLLALLVGSAMALPIAAQSTAGPLRVGVMAGLNSATLGGSDADDADRKNGLLAGVYLVKPLTSSIALRPELLYSQKGAETSFDDEDFSGKVKFKLDYIDIPVLLQFEPTGGGDVRPHLFLGPSFGFKASCKIEGTGSGVSASVDCEDSDIDLKSFDVGGVVGAGLSFPLGGVRAALGARYQHGFSDLESGSSVKNRVLSLHIGLEFGK
jgi:Outer membrane protein beta-barrel domain